MPLNPFNDIAGLILGWNTVIVFTLHATCSGARTWSAPLTTPCLLLGAAIDTRVRFCSARARAFLVIPIPKTKSLGKSCAAACHSARAKSREADGSREICAAELEGGIEKGFIYLVSGGDLWRRCAWRRTSFQHLVPAAPLRKFINLQQTRAPGAE
jgi:hypothetical protein